jgi:FkbM family methyltransferase
MPSATFATTPVRANWLRALLTAARGVRGLPRLAYMSRRLAFGKHLYVVQTANGQRLAIDPNDYGHLMRFFFPYAFEHSQRALLADILRPGDLFVELGANLGVMSVDAAALVGASGLVVAVEPNPAMQHLLAESFRQQAHAQSIRLVRAGIAERGGQGVLHMPKGGTSVSMEVREATSDEAGIALLTVDEVLANHSEGRTPTLISIDIEGHETGFLQSARTLFAGPTRPALLFEFHPARCLARGLDAESIRQGLHALGYDERWFVPVGQGYRLLNDRNRRLEQSTYPNRYEHNIFATENWLAQHPTFKAKWEEGV